MAKTISPGMHVMPAIVLVVVCLALFFNTLANEFIWDDISLITENRYIRDYRNIPLFFTPNYWNELHPVPGFYRPLRAASLAVDYFFWWHNPAGYHATNLLLHMINVVLVFYLVSIIAGREPGRSGEGIAGWRGFLCIPFLTALFFATHPIHTESINLVKNRSDLLAFCFFLLSFMLFIKHITGAGRMNMLSIIGAWFCFIPAVLSKEMALTLPGVLVLYAVSLLTGPERKKALIRILPYGIVLLAYFWFRHSFIRSAEKLPPSVFAPENISQHVLTVIKTIGCYFKMLVLPFPLNIEHAFTVPRSVLEPNILFSLLLLLLIGVFVFWAFHYARIVFFAIGWILLTLIPAANLVYLVSSPIAEQRLYIPSLGFCLLLGFGIKSVSRIKTRRSSSMRAFVICGILTGLIVSLYAGITFCRNFDWRNEITFYSRAVALNPDSPKIQNNFGRAFSKSKRYEDAIRHYQAGLRLAPKSPLLHNNLGMALFETGRVEEAIAHYERALSVDPDYAKALYNLAVALSKAGKSRQAIEHFLTALRLIPDYPEAHNSLGAELAKDGQFEEAASHYLSALRLEPNFTQAHNNLGLALAATGQTEDAINHFQTAISLNPDYAEAHTNLGVAFASSGRFEEAIRHYEIALRLDPECAKLHNNLGAALAKVGRFEEAISHYFKAIRLQSDYAKAMNNLGLALVATGRVTEAIDYYLDALKIVPDNAEVDYNLGTAFVTRGEYQKASGCFKRALAIDPDHEGAQREYRKITGKDGLPADSSPDGFLP